MFDLVVDMLRWLWTRTIRTMATVRIVFAKWWKDDWLMRWLGYKATHRWAQYLEAVFTFCIFTLAIAELIARSRQGLTKPSVIELGYWFLRQRGFLALVASTFVIVIGLGAYLWKRGSQWTYGLVEIAFGGSVSYNLIYTIQGVRLDKVLTIGTAVYIVSRGLNNFAEGWQRRREDPEHIRKERERFRAMLERADEKDVARLREIVNSQVLPSDEPEGRS